MTQATLAPVRRSITVHRPAQDTFRIFTEQLGSWWPLATHSLDPQHVTGAAMEPRVGGRVFEIRDDGTEFPWGEVLVWEPPSRLVLAWRIHRSPAATEVEVRFTADGERTLVELEHRGWELLGDDAARARQSYDGGWPRVLDRFLDAAS